MPRVGVGIGSSRRMGGTGSPSYFAPYPAPAGYYWDFVTFNGEVVTLDGEPVVALVEA